VGPEEDGVGCGGEESEEEVAEGDVSVGDGGESGCVVVLVGREERGDLRCGGSFVWKGSAVLGVAWSRGSEEY